MSIFDLKEKSIIVTAGTSYLGAAIAEAMAEFGANLTITSRDVKKARAAADKLKSAYGVKTLALFMDLDDDNSIKQMFNDIVSTFGGVDVLVNNASYSRPAALKDMTIDTWSSGMDGTAGGMFKTIREALEIMLAQEHGNIINISSMYGVVSPNPDIYGNLPVNPANYGAGKAAIIQLTKYIACVYGSRGIRANCICPGAFPVPGQDSDFISRLADKTPLKRVGLPDDLKGVAVLLASDAAAYITGQNYIVDGGWTAW